MFTYIVCAIIIASILSFVVFVVIGAIEHKKHININWLLLMATIVLSCSLVMVIIYHSQHDLTAEDVQTSYNQGYEDGKAAEQHTLPTNEEMEEWFSSTKEVVVGSNEGGDTAVHIIDGNGEEWVLFADSNK